MSAGHQWVQEPRDGEPRQVEREPREPLDLDRWVEVATVVGGVAMIYGGVAFYLGGGAYAAWLLGGWVGALVLAVFGLPPAVYALAKWSQRKVDREIRTDARHHHETTGGGLSGIRTVD